MNPVPLVPETAPFSPAQRAWLNGFFAGVFSREPAPALVPGATAILRPLTVLFGSQTGTAESLARKAAKAAGPRGFAPTVLDMAQADLAQLAALQNVLVITSTYGDGEPPDNARALHAALQSAAAGVDRAAPPRLPDVRYSVCALGDTNYPAFCECGKQFDAYLGLLGATRVVDRADCDLDYETKFHAWLDASLSHLGATAGSAVQAAGGISERAPAQPASIPISSSPVPAFGRATPFPAPVVAVRRLSGPASTKEVNHVEFSLEGSGLSYEPGDALGVCPQNCPDLVEEVLRALGCDGEEAVPAAEGAPVSLRLALTERCDLGRATTELIALLQPGAAETSPTPGSAITAPHVIDVLLAAWTKAGPAEFVRALRKLQPRLYSISSSPAAHPGSVHLTVGAVRYDAHGRTRKGACSTFLGERALAAGRVGVFVHRNPAFRLPASADTPLVMVGPGTGIAPFRAFLAHRRATRAPGRNWLLFGDQREATDFLYRDELQEFQRSGALERLDLAWSRDQAAKVYVQHRMIEAAPELFSWLEAGAHFYVCGDASRMAKDVDAALHRVVELAGRKSPDQAADYVQALRAAKRYQRDVY